MNAKPQSIYLIYRQEGPGMMVEIPEMFSVEGFVTSEDEAREACSKLNIKHGIGSNLLGENGYPDPGDLEALNMDGLWFWWEICNPISEED